MKLLVGARPIPASSDVSRAQIKLAGVAETVGKFGLAVSVACFLAQTIIWLAEMGKKVRPRLSIFLKLRCWLTLLCARRLASSRTPRASSRTWRSATS